MQKRRKKNNSTTTLSALLDFYSDKASAHVNVLVAITIGLFGILTLIDKVNSNVLSFLFLILWVAGLWTLFNFSYFSEHATCTKNLLMEPWQITAKRLDFQIHDIVVGKWEKTLLRCGFLKLKKTRWRRHILKLGKMEGLGLSFFFPFFYFVFGLIVRIYAFPGVFWEVKSITDALWLILLLAFILDLCSLVYPFLKAKLLVT